MPGVVRTKVGSNEKRRLPSGPVETSSPQQDTALLRRAESLPLALRPWRPLVAPKPPHRRRGSFGFRSEGPREEAAPTLLGRDGLRIVGALPNQNQSLSFSPRARSGRRPSPREPRKLLSSHL